MKLYEISKDYTDLMNRIIDADGEVTESDSLALSAIQGNIQEKGGNIAAIIRTWEGESDTIDSEITRLEGMKKARKNAIQKIKDYLKFNMEISGIEEIKTALFKISFRKSESVE